nr:hypothetical protein [Tanacetum cinerariifolium]
MDTTIDQQVAMDEALVPRAQRLRIRRRNFRLLSDIKSKESTLQLVYDVLRKSPFFKAFLVTADVPEIYMQEFWATATVHHHAIDSRWTTRSTLNSKAYKEYYAIATGEAAPKPKASVKRARSGSDTSITPPTAAVSPRLTALAKGKQTAKASKAKSLSVLFEVAMTEAQQMKLVTKRSMHQMHISQPSGSGADKGTGDDIEEKDDDGDKEDEGDDGEEGNDDDNDEEDDGAEEGGGDELEFDKEETDGKTRDEERFDPIPQTPESSEDEGTGAEDIDLNVKREEGLNEEEEEDKLYRDVNINQGRGL